MKFFVFGSKLLFLFLIVGPTVAFDATALANYIQSNYPTQTLGMIVQDAKTGKVLYEKQSKEAFEPASTTKLFTAAAMLLEFGPQFQYETTLKFNTNDKKEQVLKGNIYIQFTGDPSFSRQDLTQLIKAIKDFGIEKIAGNIIIDNTRFQAPYYAWGWTWNSLPWYFSAPITTVIVDENSVGVRFTSNQSLGGKATLSYLKPLPLGNITQHVITVTERESNEECEIMLSMDDKNNLQAGGCWPKHDTADDLKLAIKNPDYLVQKLILEDLKASHITFSGKINFEKMPENLETISRHLSPALQDLIKPVLQDSNNIYSDSFFKTLGFKRFQKGSFQAGGRAFQAIAEEKLQLSVNDIKLWDGSGGSRYNLISPASLGKLLYMMYNHPTLSKIFIDAMSIAGETGTLKKRFLSSDLKGKIRAKTGSLQNESTLAGFITTQNNKDLIFVIMINNSPKDASSLERIHDEICEQIYK